MLLRLAFFALIFIRKTSILNLRVRNFVNLNLNEIAIFLLANINVKEFYNEICCRRSVP